MPWPTEFTDAERADAERGESWAAGDGPRRLDAQSAAFNYGAGLATLDEVIRARPLTIESAQARLAAAGITARVTRVQGDTFWLAGSPNLPRVFPRPRPERQPAPRPARARPRWGVFVWDADGDMGDGVLAGPVRTPEAAELLADKVRRSGERADVDEFMQAIVVRVVPASTAARDIVELAGGQ
jgi:hypothetical protein